MNSLKKKSWTQVERDYILRSFLKEMLPPQEKPRRNMACEANYVITTLSRQMFRHFGFRVEAETALTQLSLYGYYFYTKFGIWDTKTRRTIGVNMDEVFTKYKDRPTNATVVGDNNAFVYVNMDGKKLRALRTLVVGIPSNTSADKLKLIEEAAAEVEAFKARMAQHFHQPMDAEN